MLCGIKYISLCFLSYKSVKKVLMILNKIAETCKTHLNLNFTILKYKPSQTESNIVSTSFNRASSLTR
jgi:hypothetical protein